MNSFFREHFKGAMRNLCFIVGIILTAIILSFIRHNYLNMTFRAKSPTLEKRYFVLDASFIHILSCSHVIKSISNYFSAFKELIIVDFFSFLANLVQPCMYMALKPRVKLKQSCTSSCWFRFFYMLISKQELARQVWSFNVVRISNNDFTFRSHVYHCEVL